MSTENRHVVNSATCNKLLAAQYVLLDTQRGQMMSQQHGSHSRGGTGR